MKGLNKLALVAAIAAASSAQAELVAMDDAALSATTGQAGLTIDVNEANINIGEIQYKDEGSLFISGFQLGGAGLLGGELLVGNNDYFDNLRITVDIAGDSTDVNTIGYGLGKVDSTTNVYGTTVFTNNGTAESAGGASVNAAANYFERDASGNRYADIDDGDMVIGLDAQDQDVLVDMGFLIGEVSLGESAVATGSRVGAFGVNPAHSNTVLMADTALAGAIGPVDIVIDGQDGGMNINAYFGLEGQIEFPFVATSMHFKLHNNRGSNSLIAKIGTDKSGGFAVYDMSGAHANVTISKWDADADSDSDGLALDINNFEGDMDLENIVLGSDSGAQSIGSLYITDLKMNAKTVVYGH
ncbi:MAG: hypothetical protein CSA50_07210 [Gammaproteobacteria bacterium]|nr:MAG: hypothetical protein CSA50_07210 [Gammaproteobacteria bacterium]